MNTIFVTQSGVLRTMFDLMRTIEKKNINFNKIGFYTADSLFFNQYTSKLNEREKAKLLSFPILKEWEILSKSRSIKINKKLISSYEKKIGDPYLWTPLIAHRRIYLGKDCKIKQQYKPRFSHSRMLRILQVALIEIESLINKIKPDIILGFTMSTFGDYLFYLFAKEKKIPYLQIRPTRIENYVYFDNDPPNIQNFFKDYNKAKISRDSKKKAKEFLERSRFTKLIYEGVINKKKVKKKEDKIHNRISKLIQSEIKFLTRPVKEDNQIPGVIKPFLYGKIIQPIKKKTYELKYFRKFVRKDELKKYDYIFYPLHSEPEVAISVFGKYFQNQIEVIRNIAQSMPINMKLIIKEHPRSLGLRNQRYYSKLLEIPNALMMDPKISSHNALKYSKAVIVISGTIGFEALINKKPVISLGNCIFNVLPNSMQEHVADYTQLPHTIKRLLNNYKYNEKDLLNYISYLIEKSYPVNFYSQVLKKEGRESFENNYNYNDALSGLGDYLIQVLKDKKI